MKIKDFINYEQPNDYIVSSEQYNQLNNVPVLTAGQSFVLGYTDDKDGIYTKGNCIIFDDFTTSVHYVDFPFKVKSSAMKILTTNKSADLKYCYYLLLSISKMPASHKRQWISTTSEKEWNLPVLKKQKNIAYVLDMLTAAINNYKKEIHILDELIKARFVEMFGTLDFPIQKFKKAKLKELCNKITDGKHGGCKIEKGTERYFVGAREIYDGEVHYTSAPEINIDEFEKDYKRCNVEIGDFLIVNTGATIGKSAIASDKRAEHTLLQKSVALLKVKKEVLNPIFLKWCYKINTKMYMVESASAQSNLLLSKINSTEIYVPDIEIQNQFADFVKQVDKSKLAVQQSLEKTQQLFDSLMQEYFG